MKKQLLVIGPLIFMMSFGLAIQAEEADEGFVLNRGHKFTEEQLEKHLRARQEHLLLMHDLSTKILAEQDDVKKEQLKNKQLELMKEHHQKMMTLLGKRHHAR